MRSIIPLLLLLTLSTPAPARSGSGKKPWLGVGLDPASRNGVVISQVFPGSPAHAAGIKPGDRVAMVAGRPARTVKGFIQTVRRHRPGQQLRLTLRRGGRSLVLRVKLAMMPTYAGRVRAALLGKAAPAFRVTRAGSVGPAVITNQALRGEVVLLEFWATWCGACIQTIPLLKSIHQRLGPAGLKIVALARDRPARLQRFISALQLPYIVGVDPKGSSFGAFGVGPIPAFLLVDRQGVVRGVAAGRSWPRDLQRLLGRAAKLLGPRVRPRPRP